MGGDLSVACIDLPAGPHISTGNDRRPIRGRLQCDRLAGAGTRQPHANTFPVSARIYYDSCRKPLLIVRLSEAYGFADCAQGLRLGPSIQVRAGGTIDIESSRLHRTDARAAQKYALRTVTGVVLDR